MFDGLGTVVDVVPVAAGQGRGPARASRHHGSEA